MNGGHEIVNTRCIVCNRELPDGYAEELCKRVVCRTRYTAHRDLNERMNRFYTHFWGRKPSEELYKDYFQQEGYEAAYLEFVKDDPQRCSRRSYFWANIGSCHTLWRDEFGKTYKGNRGEEIDFQAE